MPEINMPDTNVRANAQKHGITTILCDLDDTLYPGHCGLWEAIGERINLFMYERLHFPLDELTARRKELYTTYGTTLRGLKIVYGIDELEYLAFVHDVPVANFIQPDPRTRVVLNRYHQRRVIFTNADTNHARRVLNILELSDCFDQIIDILAIWPYCKPQPGAFLNALEKAGNLSPAECVMIDDNRSNLAAARELGLYTVWIGAAEIESETGQDAAYDAGVPTFADLPAVLDRILIRPVQEEIE
jgi:putative hydrolase of the HAD superfamily